MVSELAKDRSVQGRGAARRPGVGAARSTQRERSRRAGRFLGTVLMAASSMLFQPRYAVANGVDSYPDKPVRMVVAYGVGGVADNIGRVLAAGLTKALGRSVFVDNRGGGGGTIGATLVAKAAPDGYTILLTSPPMIAVAPLLLPDIYYNPTRDFTPIGTFVTTPNILVVNNSLPVKTLADLVSYARGPARGDVSFASGGTGSTGDLSGQILKRTANIDLIAVPYKSSALGFPDVIAGRVSMLFDSVPSTLGFIRAGQVRPIVVMSDKRSPLLPAVPTAVEEGYPAATMQFWMGIEGPANMPPVIVARLNAALRTAMATPEVAKSMESLGAQPFLTSPQEFSALQDRDIAKYKPLIREIGLGAGD
ncbi:tripartite tricarboxylate transporter receptor family protein [Paraburkholderia xenovorans LB400]|jgi:tripartite-type tricarboxylate transporter receptor subunit TctC|nr:tripartite tricarboxylate transporter receptor family protein [Paraburkholderia xenovorans LB400]NPT36472.1 tripartite tricarboxylate transporter substrate binding protein [Paraburkholderia xenovorans]